MMINERVESVFASARPPIAEDDDDLTEVVVVVEADSTLRQLLAQRLRRTGCAPVAVRSWPEAVHFIRLGTAVTLIILGPSIPLTEGCSEPAVAHIPIITLPSVDPCGALAEIFATDGYDALPAGDGQGSGEALADTPRPVDIIISSCLTTGCPIRATCTGSRGSGSCLLDARAF